MSEAKGKTSILNSGPNTMNKKLRSVTYGQKWIIVETAF